MSILGIYSPRMRVSLDDRRAKHLLA